jgi:two-component system, chemotaxis family, response regulator Rcp1
MDCMLGEGSFHILIIEDNLGDVRLMQEALREGGMPCSLQVATDGTEALDVLRRLPPFAEAMRPDLIFLDLNLPGISGMHVLEDVKSDPHLRQIPVIVFSTSSAEQEIYEAYDRHANCYITKPIDLDVFMRVIRLIGEFWFTMAKLPGRETNGQ